MGGFFSANKKKKGKLASRDASGLKQEEQAAIKRRDEEERLNEERRSREEAEKEKQAAAERARIEEQEAARERKAAAEQARREGETLLESEPELQWPDGGFAEMRRWMFKFRECAPPV